MNTPNTIIAASSAATGMQIASAARRTRSMASVAPPATGAGSVMEPSTYTCPTTPDTR